MYVLLKNCSFHPHTGNEGGLIAQAKHRNQSPSLWEQKPYTLKALQDRVTNTGKDQGK